MTMFRFKTIILETPYVGGYAELQTAIDRLVSNALDENGNCQLVNIQVSQLGEKNASEGIFTIFLYTVEVLEGTPVPTEPAESV